ncbi:S-adenosyl-L-methionine dependent methyltransferase [Lenzites betulinus]|nr:S-adenosyl-L-methionine dependent methyltransferase [Lenzites betulinus]
MHPRNPYKTPPDFLVLADAHPPLREHIIHTPNGPSIDFRNDASQRALTEAFLSRDFAIRITLPPARLCPPVPNRLNYILWLEDVANVVSLVLGQNADRHVRGLDIGTGASVIYPLLGCRTCPSWTFVATEIDELSLSSARDNVQRNGLQARIEVRKADPAAPILAPLFESDAPPYDFTMCNPPFYGSREEVQQSAEGKEVGPNAVCTGADVEMITPGGEAAFVGQMVAESLAVRDRCRWFTSMLGKMSSLTHLVQTFRDNKIDDYAITELVQGQTRRWVIAWSFSDIRLPDSLGRLPHQNTHHPAQPRNTLHQPLPHAPSVPHAASATRSTLASIDGLSMHDTPHDQLSPSPSPSPSPPPSTTPAPALDVLVSIPGDTWSRAARRRKLQQHRMDVEASASAAAAPSLVCRVRCEGADGGETRDGDGHTTAGLVFDWLRGRDRALFESFASHVGRKVGAASQAPKGAA